MEILNTVLIDPNSGSIAAAIVLTITALVLFFLAVAAWEFDGKSMSVVIAAVGVGLACLAYNGYTADHTPYKQYEARITDMSKFDTTKYQILEQRGKIFVVKELTKGER